MCGIIGLVGFDDLRLLRSMNDVISHRGPDDAGAYVDPRAGIALAMRRLSIVDLAGGHQPMHNEDSTVWIVFNGEIYNASELRPDLVTRGHRFATDHSDTEVLLHLYEELGPACLSKLNGMFAFLIYDKRRRVVFGARDRMGIKPFYYWQDGASLAVASELKSLLQLPKLRREINLQSLYHYVTLLYVPDATSIVKGVNRLPPAHRLLYDLDTHNLSVERYWRPCFSVEDRSEEEWVEMLRHEMRRAVKCWTMSDVPVACSLSGGLDSAAIVGLLAEGGTPHISTYTLGFSGTSEAAWDETVRARSVAQRYDTDHHEFFLEPDDLLRDLVSMVWHLDEPYAGGLPSWYVFQAMSRNFKVGLTGTGGDELFGNYGKWAIYEELPLLRAGIRLHRQAPGVGKAVAAAVGLFGAMVDHLPAAWPWVGRGRAVSRLPRFFGEPFGRNYYANDIYMSDATKVGRVFKISTDHLERTSTYLQQLHDSRGATDVRNAVAAVDFQTQLADEFLCMTDRFSMAHSLEARTPLLDHQLVELVFRIPPYMRTRRNDLKYLFKQAVGDLLPPELLTAPKSGFVIPVKLWLKGPLLPMVNFLLNADRLAHQDIFRPDFYAHWVEPHLEDRADHTWQIWAALMFQLWHVVFVEQNCHSAPTFDWTDLA